jgi:hypothetical protein
MKLFSHLKAETSAGNQTVDEACFKGLQAWAIDGRRWPSTVWLPALVSALRCENSFIPTEGVTEVQRVVANAMRRSPSIHVMMLAEEHQSPDFKACFNKTERDTLRQILLPFHEAERQVIQDGGYTRATAESVEVAAKIALDWIEQRANIIVTTASNAMEPRFIQVRRAHALGMEEAGLMSDANIWGFWSKCWDLKARIASGDVRQLPPMMFSDIFVNPFHHQGTTFLLQRLVKTGFPVYELMVTHRFGNMEILDMARRVNVMPDLRMSDTASRDSETATIVQMNCKLFGIASAVMCTNVEDSSSHADSTGSMYSRETALVTINSVVQRCSMLLGSKITVLSPYKAQTSLHRVLLKSAADQAEAQGNHVMAEQMRGVIVSTIDSYMGEENDFVIVGMLGHVGHLFDAPRTKVAATRYRLGGELIGIANQIPLKSEAREE